MLSTSDESTPFFCPGDSTAKVVRVVDGDTVHVVIDMPGLGLQKFNTRLYGINTPELRPLRSDPNRDEIIAKAKYAKSVVNDLCMNKIVYIKTHGFGKYGRLLITIYVGELCINDFLIEQGLAEKYMV